MKSNLTQLRKPRAGRPKSERESVMVAFRCDLALEARVDALAGQVERECRIRPSRSAVLRMLIERGLETVEAAD